MTETEFEKRKKLFSDPSEYEIEPKLKINEEYRKTYPDLAKSLEKYGQIEPILIDDTGYIHDGMKRIQLCGKDQLFVKEVPVNSECSNISLTPKEKRQLFLFAYNLLFANAKFGDKTELITKLAKRYGINRATAYRWLDLEYTKREGSPYHIELSKFSKKLFPIMEKLQGYSDRVKVKHVLDEGKTLEDVEMGRCDIHWVCEIDYNFMHDLYTGDKKARKFLRQMEYVKKHGYTIGEAKPKTMVVEEKESNLNKIHDLVELLSGDIDRIELSNEEKEALLRLRNVLNDSEISKLLEE